MSTLDIIAGLYFLAVWFGFSWLTDGRRGFSRVNLTRGMNRYRHVWMRNLISRDLRIIDTSILGGLQNGTAFFASATIFAIGGCFGLIGAADRVLLVFGDLPVDVSGGRTGFELKVAGLAAIFAYAFFKFGWAYRLFNYCAILIGAVPMAEAAQADRRAAEAIADKAAAVNVLAGKHFNAGLRAVFLAMGYLGWLIGPHVFMLTTSIVLFVLLRRQFFSPERTAILGGENPPP